MKPRARSAATGPSPSSLAALAVGLACCLGLIATVAPSRALTRARAAASHPDAALARAVPFETRLKRAPLDPPLVLNGGFGEYRSNHFHAGLDLGTGGRVGQAVYAPLSGWIERVRASGIGYGRSLYLHASDGRLLVFGHLDAFAEPIASYVVAAQESTGQYEQDLWPAPGQFRCTAGQRIAWTGESGSGGPHLHFEIRRNDMAYHPLRAGLALRDRLAPSLTHLTLEPLDDSSFVERGAAPHTLELGARSETLLVEGRVRAVVGARVGVWRGVDRRVPWSTVMEFGGERVACRFDSISWATDMAESDYLYDVGRVAGGGGMLFWAPPGFRPRVMVTSVPLAGEAGTLIVRRGDPPRLLRLEARDVSGASTTREVWLRPPRAAESGPDTTQRGGRAEPDSAGWFRVAALPNGFLRITFLGAPFNCRRVTIAGRRASGRLGEWSVVWALPKHGEHEDVPIDIPVAGQDASGRPWRASFRAVLRAEGSPRAADSKPRDFEWALEPEARFENVRVLYRWSGPVSPAPPELVPRSATLEVMPATLRLRHPIRLAWQPPPAGRSRIGIYRADEADWERIDGALDSAGVRRVGLTRHLGRFALFEDTLAPRIAPIRPPRVARAGPYSRWALEAKIIEAGSGVNANATRFEVDGRPVPSEWDSEAQVLRWRPPRAPTRGGHRFTVVAVDRSGNQRRRSGDFAID